VTAPPGVYTPYDITQLPKPLTVSAVGITASQQLMTGPGLIIGVSLAQVTGAGKTVGYLYDGTDTTGNLLAALAANTSTGITYAPCAPGIPFDRGLYINVTTGQLTITVTYIPLQQPLL
jgi:hypothetical protein